RVLARPLLFGVVDEDEVGTSCGPRLAHAGGVVLDARRADLELHSGETQLFQFGDLFGDAERAVVVAGDGDHRQARAVSAPEPPERGGERLADGVPQGGIDTGRCNQTEPAVAED